MSTVIDANVLIALFSTKENDGRKIRVETLIAETRKRRSRLIVPSPAFAEFAAKASKRELDFVLGQPLFQVAPFDGPAALECAQMIKTWVGERSQAKKEQDRQQGMTAHRFKAKFDMQILSIARVANAGAIITNDRLLRKQSAESGINTLDISDLPIPDSERQGVLELPAPKSNTHGD